MRNIIKLMSTGLVLVLCGFQAVALAGPIIMPRVYIPPVRVAPVIAQPARVTPPPARVTTPAPKPKQTDSTVNSLVPIMTGIAVMNATTSANTINSSADPSDILMDEVDEVEIEQ
jgi:hypothetical protein